jgi:type I restriction enzyme M protein
LVALKGDKDIGDKINKIIAKLAEANDLKGIIGLPANLFYGTGIPACIIVIDKENADKRDRIFIIDASKGFIKDGNKNRLREQDIHKIVDVFNKQLELPKYSRLVPLEEIAQNEYNLNIPRYIDSQEAEDIQDISAHLLGGIPNRDIDDLKRYWAVYPGLRKELFTPITRKGYSQLTPLDKGGEGGIKQTIFNHPEFVSYSEKIDKIIQTWCNNHVSLLKDLSPATKPKELIFQLSEAILTAFSETNLIDKYDVFQHLMMYWMETMKDDVYFIIEEGWKAQPYAILDKKGKPKKDEWDCDLVPKHLVINRYFTTEQSKIEQLEADKEAITRDKEEMAEEYSGEDGYLEEVKNDKGKITKGNVQARIKELQQELDWGEELQILKDYLALFDKEAEADKKVKDAQKKLDKLLLEKYKKLTESEIKTLVVDDKWLATISQEVKTELDRISQRLTQRIKELAERYERTLPELTTRVNELESKVNNHLTRIMKIKG